MEIDGIVPMRDFRRIDSKMSQKDGMKLLAGRLGLSAEKVRKLVRDRYPCGCPKEERRGFSSCYVKCFLMSDILFTDVLHVGYEELAHLGVGRRYLCNRILRAVVAGTCDAIDRSGKSGDFPPRSWMDERSAEITRKVQEDALNTVKSDKKELLQSIKVRMRNMSTQVLLDIADHCDAIRSRVAKSASRDPWSGLECLSGILRECRSRFYRVARSDDLKNRRRARRKSKFHRKPTEGFGTVSRRLAHAGFSVLLRGLTDLRKLMDPAVPNWYRRPTDPDWEEGLRGSRKPVVLKRRAMFDRYGLGSVPGITEPIDASEWGKVRTDWTMSEVKERFGK